MQAAVLFGLEWTRPLGFLALALPVLLVLLDRSRSRPQAVATGTLALWREVRAARTSRDARARRAVPPRLWLLAAALTLGALSLAGPREAQPRAPRTWRVVVDRSPSMYLPWRADGAHAPSGTRLARGLEALAERLPAWLGPGDELEWLAFEPAGRAVHAGPEPPAAWRAEPAAYRDEPPWETLDAPGTLWLTDRDPRAGRRVAGLVAAGGAALPGLVGRAGAQGLDWDGARLVPSAEALPPARYRLAGEPPDELRRVVAIWAEERGLVEAEGPSEAVELELRTPGGAVEVAVAASRDGWRLSGSARAGGAPTADADGPLVPWLSDGGGLPLVTTGPGRVVLALTALEAVEGDPASFAVSWAELLDGACLPPPGAVPVAERAAAGPPVAAGASRPPAREGGGVDPRPIDAWLALAALLLALGATWRG